MSDHKSGANGARLLLSGAISKALANRPASPPSTLVCGALVAALTFASGAFATTPLLEGERYIRPKAAQVVPVAKLLAQSEYALARSDEPFRQAGARVVHDYGSFKLWRVGQGKRHLLEKAGASDGSIQWQSPFILFEAGEFDVAHPGAGIPAAFRAASGGGEHRIILVQFNGPITDPALNALVGSGAKIVAPLSGNAYAVLVDDASSDRLQRSLSGNALLRGIRPLAPFYKLAGGLPERARAGLGDDEIDITVQIAKYAQSTASKRIIEKLAIGSDALVWDDRLTKESLRLRVRESDIEAIAALPDVFAVEPFLQRQKFDEVQGQILAANFVAGNTGPATPGYLDFLASKGFPTTPSVYPIVDVVDDGLGSGSLPDGGDVTFREFGLAANPSRLVSIFNCTSDPLADGGGGHGHLNTNIVGGFDARGEAPDIQGPYEDPNGYLRGLGINPFARLAHTKIFRNSGSYSVVNCGSTDAGVIRSSFQRGAAITNNSWGSRVAGDYDDSSEAYDIGTRDADLTTAGNQPMIHVFSAGNQGSSGASSIGSPGTGKNVITVGASENFRPGPDETGAWNDGCGINANGANSAMDVIGFSSRGPAEGGRTKPEVIAPGTHVQGTASTAASYDGSGVCDQYRPTNQTIFASSSGTSHSGPAVAGVASLVYWWLQDKYGIATPSAAATKAYMMAHPTYLTGTDANDTLPSNVQGYGMPNLDAAFDSGTDRFVIDQTEVFDSTGDSRVWYGSVVDPDKPLRVSLAWTDAPGAINDTTPQVNNLDLEVVVDGQTYLGNRFSGQYSTTGGTADANNNYEAVFLPPGTTGAVEIRVLATGIVGDGIPNSGDATDQDFALVVSNFAQDPTFVVDASPSRVSACGVDSVTWDVEVRQVNGYSDEVTLSASGLPAFASATFDPVSGDADPGFVSELTVTTTAGTSGNYPFVVEGTDGDVVRTDTVTLAYSAVAAATPTLTAPADGAPGVNLRPTLTWDASAEVSEYLVELATDPGFTDIVWSTTTVNTTAEVELRLSGETLHYWRVTARNNCGDSVSDTSEFTTREAPTLLLVDDDDNSPDVLDRYTATLDGLVGAGNYEIRDTGADGEPTLGDLNGFTKVIWFSGDAFWGPSSEVEPALAGWLDQGSEAARHCLLISSQDYVFGLGSVSAFMTNYLAVGSLTPDPPSANRYTDVAGETLYGGISGPLNNAPAGFASQWADLVTASPDGFQAFRNIAGTLDTGSARFVPEYFTTYLPFAPEILQPAQMSAVLGRFLSTCDGTAINLPPSFTGTPYSFEVPYTATAGTTVGSVEATDPEDDELTFSITAGNTGGAFAIDPVSGEITVAGALTLAETYTLTVQVEDTEDHAVTTPVQIYVFDPDAPPPVCFTTVTAIPDNTPAGVSMQLVVPETGTLVDLDVSFRANHTWVGDLIVTLSNGTTTAILLDRPGAPAVSSVGCPSNGPDVIIDDEGSISAESGCSTVDASPAYPVGSRVYPQGFTLSAFNGQPLNGTWTLTVSDNFSQDTGSVLEWCLRPTLAPPTVEAEDDSYSVDEDETLTVAAPGVLDNDTGTGLTAELVDDVQHGSLTFNADGSFSYTPDADFNGTDTFTYFVSDGTDDSEPATVTITVDPVNDAPVAADDSYNAVEDTALPIAAPGVLDNDTDVDGDVLTAVVVDGPEHGTLVLESDGSFTYTPDADYCSTTPDTFTYVANDGTVDSAPATVSITVSCENDGPVANPIPDAFATATLPFELDVSDAFVEPKGEDLAFSATGLPASLDIDPVTGVISGTPTEDEIGSYEVTVIAADPADASASSTFTLEVLPILVFGDGFED